MDIVVPESTTVLKGLENMKIGLPLSILDLFRQLQGSDVMEFQAMHSSGATVSVKMSCTDVNLIFEIQAAGNELLIDEGEGWQCMINHVTGVVYHHSSSQVEVPSQTATEETDNSEQLVYYTVGESEQAEPATFETVTPEENVPQPETEDICKVEPIEEATEIKTEVIENFPTAQNVGSIELVEAAPLEYVAFADSEGQGREWSTAINYIPHLEVEKMEEGEQEDNVHEEVIQTVSSAGVMTQDVEVAMVLEESDHNPSVAGEEVLSFIGQPEVASQEKPGPSRVPRIIDDVSAFTCYICDRKYVLVEKLETHVQRMHKAVFDLHKVQKTVMKKAHICFICNQVCPHYDAMKKHLQRVHKTGDAFRNNRKVGDPGVSPAQCMICLRQFVSPPCLYNHTRKEHKGDPMYTAALHNVQDLRLQHRKRRSKLTMDCPFCAKTFHGRVLFKHLNRDHADGDNFAKVLEQCKTAYNRASKQVWQPRHPLKPPTVNCTKCHISILKRNLPRHLKLCTGKPRNIPETTEKCPLCHRIFLKSALARHMKEKCSANADGKHVFMCKCDQLFETFGQLRQHLKDAHGESIDTSTLAAGKTVYVCGPCDGAASFATVTELDEHTRQVHLRLPANPNPDEEPDDEMVIQPESASEGNIMQNGSTESGALVQENAPLKISQGSENTVECSLPTGCVQDKKTINPKPKRGTYAEKIQLLKNKMEQDISNTILVDGAGTGEGQSSNVVVTSREDTSTRRVNKASVGGKWIHTKDGILKWDSGVSPEERGKKEFMSSDTTKDYMRVSVSSAGNQTGTVDGAKGYVSDVGDRKLLLLPRATTSSSSWTVTGETEAAASVSKDESQSQKVLCSESPKRTVLVLGTSGKAKQTSQVMTVGSSPLASLQYQGLPESRVSGEPSCKESKTCTPSAKTKSSPISSKKTTIKFAKPQARPEASRSASPKLVTVIPPARRVLLAKDKAKKITSFEPPREPEVEREEVQRESNQRRSSRHKKPKTWDSFEVRIK